MATSSTSAFSRKRNRCKLSVLPLLLLFLVCLFLFSRRPLESKLSFYRDLISQTPVPLLPSPPRSAEFNEKFDDLRQPVSSDSDRGENVDGNSTVSSGLSAPGFQGEESNEERNVPSSSKSDLYGETTENSTGQVISSEAESQGNFEGITGEPISENGKTAVPVSSKDDLDEKTRGNSEILGVKEKSFEEAVSPGTGAGGVIDNAIAEKLRNCDIYKGKWVRDEGYPLYRPGSCPYVDEAFDCLSNGRPDSEYLKWRWKPDECDLPRFSILFFSYGD